MIYLLSKFSLNTCQKILVFSPRYFLLDLLWVVLGFLTFSFIPNIEKAIVTGLLLLLFFIVCITDFNFLLIPDVVLFGFALVGILNILLGNSTSAFDAFLGAVVGFSLFFGIGWLGKLAFKKDALGGGDIKLVVVLGLFIGWQGIFIMLFIGSLSALILVCIIRLIKNQTQPHIPFGPFLVLGSIVAYIWGNDLLYYFLQASTLIFV
ncbi:MAG: prepilin peptidase [candidate division Zixibacteria bacterium]|nr:prepilin peptidase [candidate division Zixibacteria bacterium]